MGKIVTSVNLEVAEYTLVMNSRLFRSNLWLVQSSVLGLVLGLGLWIGSGSSLSELELG